MAIDRRSSRACCADPMHNIATPQFASRGYMVLSADRICLIMSLILRVINAEASTRAKQTDKKKTSPTYVRYSVDSSIVTTTSYKNILNAFVRQRNRRFFVSLLSTSRHVFVRRPFFASSLLLLPFSIPHRGCSDTTQECNPSMID